MPVFLLSSFIEDLQNHGDANFARRVLQKALNSDGSFRRNRDDHPYYGIKDAWIRYVSRQNTAYRVIYLQYGDKIYLYRAGEHSIENNLTSPSSRDVTSSLEVVKSSLDLSPKFETTTGSNMLQHPTKSASFKRNIPSSEINQAIFSRRNLPHKDIWMVSPFIDSDLFAPTAVFGKLLLDQVEDGARVVLITAPPKNKNIEWMERLAERQIEIVVYPRLHSKLYCFIFDEHRRNEPGLLDGSRYSSLILLGSANLTSPGMAVGDGPCNEELCYAVSEDGLDFVEKYIAELMVHGYDLPYVRQHLIRGQWQKLEKEKW